MGDTDQRRKLRAQIRTMLEQERSAEAAAALEDYLAHYPGPLDDDIVLIGQCLARGLTDAAMDIALRAAGARPDDATAQAAVAACFSAMGRTEDSLPYLRTAAALRPDNPRHRFSLARMLVLANHAAEGRSELAALAEDLANPAFAVSSRLVLDIIPPSRAAIAASRDDFLNVLTSETAGELRIDDPFAELFHANFYLAYHAADNRPLFEAFGRFLRRSCPALDWSAPHVARPEPLSGRRVRLGIYSSFLYGHTIGLLNRGLIANLDRSRFQVVVFTRQVHGDSIQDEIAAAADKVVWVAPPASMGQLLEVRGLIAAEALDVLLYADIGMINSTYYLALSRLAPVQAVSIGHPDTTGLDSIDLFLGYDSMEPAGGEAQYSETLVRLPGPFPCYARPPIGPSCKARADFGLDEAANCYFIPQSLFKFHPDFDDVLARIADRDDDAVIVLIADRSESITRDLLARLDRRRPGLSARLHLVRRMGVADLLRLMQVSDVILDPIHYSGGNTSLEAFSIGTPIVTWPGRFMRGRVTCGFYLAMGILDPIARDFDQYVDLALRYGRDRAAAADLRRRILAANQVLYDSTVALRALEDRLEAAVRKGLEPVSGHGEFLVMGTAIGYGIDKVRVFVESLRRHYDGDVCLLVSRDITQETIDYLHSWRVRPIHFDAGRHIPVHIQTTRYVRYAEVLRDCARPYRQVLLSDVADVVFQAFPFPLADHPADLFFFMEDAGSRIGTSPSNSQWLIQTFGEGALAPLKDKPISCSGTTMGSHAGILAYCDKLLELADFKRLASFPQYRGHDQGIHNFILHHNLLPISRVENGVVVFTLGGVDAAAIGMDEAGVKVARHAHLSPIVHQYQYFPEVEAFVLEKWRSAG
ncbi:hypothetical protein [Magnetospirillum sp. SS-4]|uniref:O-linked N-acetylglucosamine transferase family protein n=1 Tax=Magnetospirillum sp. SS-4 TaxID=2681465 RepID=UPI0013833B9C|nr:hypothetical protein [Magnetospirillum sp. SS-4]CAA7621748.1 TPR repeat-containing protein (modular protein) [Magnetospirillum sp. SS-4]